LNEGYLQLVVLVQGIFEQLHAFKGACKAFLKVKRSQLTFQNAKYEAYLQYEKRAEIPTRHLPLTLRASDLFLTLRNR
jgi:hypothetical protein